MTSDWDDLVLVGRIARTHGLQGQVVVNPETDFPEERFAPGSPLWVHVNARLERVVVSSMRLQNGRAVVGFAGHAAIEAAERLVGLELRIPEEGLHPLAEGVYYRHQLVGCAVETASGEAVGTVARVEEGAGGSLLVVDGRPGEVLIPLTVDICVDVDVGSRRIVVAPPEGLLELNETRRGRLTRERATREGRT
jgi:16S rRNA processing protein RimM